MCLCVWSLNKGWTSSHFNSTVSLSLVLRFSMYVDMDTGSLSVWPLPIAIKHCLPTVNTTERKFGSQSLHFLGAPLRRSGENASSDFQILRDQHWCTGHSTKVRRRRYVAKRVGVRGAALRPSKRDISLFLNQIELDLLPPSSTSLHTISNSLSHSWRPQRWNMKIEQ